MERESGDAGSALSTFIISAKVSHSPYTQAPLTHLTDEKTEASGMERLWLKARVSVGWVCI